MATHPLKVSQYVPQNETIHRSHMQWKESTLNIFKIQTTNNVIYTLAEHFFVSQGCEYTSDETR